MAEDELTKRHPTLRAYIRERFGLYSGDKPLMQFHRTESGMEIKEDEALAEA
jgi:hypothetical protein